MPHPFLNTRAQAGGPPAGLPVDTLAHMLAGLLAEALAQSPHLASDPDALARQLAPGLSRELASSALDAAAGLRRGDPASEITPDATAADQVLAAIARHPAGRSQGITPDALASLTGMAPGLLGDAVSALVQSGDLVRDAWLIRMPESGDLLPQSRVGAVQVVPETEASRLGSDRRAIGDRRSLGERRLYERRH